MRETLQREGSAVASVPCGLMSEVLLATQEPFTGVDLLAIDLEDDNFNLIREKYSDRLQNNTWHEEKRDALQLDNTERFDLICSIGFTIYIKDDAEVQRLFKRFYAALKQNGKLVTNFAALPKEYIEKETLSKLPNTYKLISALCRSLPV